MAQEMAEQPGRLRELLARASELGEQVRDLLPSPLHGFTLIARGSSDHAAVYGRYLLEWACGLPISLAAPSLHTLYEIEADYTGQLVVAVSQSGATPEIVKTMRALCRAGGRGIALTNDARSELARAASAVLELGVGPERAVPATKTVTAELASFAILAAELGRAPFQPRQLELLPGWVGQLLDDPEPAAALAAELRGAERLLVVARGLLFGAALEAALKLRETCAIAAEGYSAADLRHGPIAAVDRATAVLVLSAPGPAAADISALVGELGDRGARVWRIAADPDAALPLPEECPESLLPIAAVVRAQQLSRELSLALGHDPDAPGDLHKVTLT